MDLSKFDTTPSEMNSITSQFHQELLKSFTDVETRLKQMLAENDEDSMSTDESFMTRRGFWEAVQSYNLCMESLKEFVTSLGSQSSHMDTELKCLEDTRRELHQERDELMEKSHELNCRLGYNALERKLEESFAELHQFTSEGSAKCFRDEAEESLKRAQDLNRLANIRSCELDRDTFKEMEQITSLFENYERDRELYVKELDLFSDIRRHQISNWLAAEAREPEEKVKGENLLDFLNLTQRERHMEPQVIKNALRMYSFNASLNFDREDNQKRMAELLAAQEQVNQMSISPIVLPRETEAKTNLLVEDIDSEDIHSHGDGNEPTSVVTTGRTLHKCTPVLNLASETLIEPNVLERFESALRWEEADGMSFAADPVSDLEHGVTTLGASNSSSTQTEVKGGDSMCGDADSCLAQIDFPIAGSTTEGFNLTKTASDRSQPIGGSTHSYSQLRHIESTKELTTSADRQLHGLVRRKPSKGRAVESLTNVCETGNFGKASSSRDDADLDERDTRSQGGEPVNRLASGGNKSREHVPSNDKV